jgi:hypothetical protein
MNAANLICHVHLKLLNISLGIYHQHLLHLITNSLITQVFQRGSPSSYPCVPLVSLSSSCGSVRRSTTTQPQHQTSCNHTFCHFLFTGLSPPLICAIINVCWTDERKVKDHIGKTVPLQAWSGPEGSRKLRFPDFMTTAQDGGKVVSLTHRPPLPPGNAPGTHFC